MTRAPLAGPAGCSGTGTDTAPSHATSRNLFSRNE